MASLNAELKSKANPLLVVLETFVIDWWLLPIFSLIYSPTPFGLRYKFYRPLADHLSDNGFNFEKRDAKSFDEYAAAVLADAEYRFAKRTPLRFLFLASLLWLASTFFAPVLASSGALSPVEFLVVALSAVSIWKYLTGRWCIYKIYRIVSD